MSVFQRLLGQQRLFCKPHLNSCQRRDLRSRSNLNVVFITYRSQMLINTNLPVVPLRPGLETCSRGRLMHALQHLICHARLATLDLSRTRRLNLSKLNTSSRTHYCDAAIGICAARVIGGQCDIQMLSQHAQQPGMHMGNTCRAAAVQTSAAKNVGTPVNANSRFSKVIS